MSELTRRVAPRRSLATASGLALVLVLLFAGVLVGLHVRDYTRVGPSDELQHLDYLNRVVRDGDIVRRGDLFHQEALRTEACQGLDAAFDVPPCEERRYDPTEFQESGVNTAYINPPIYYGLTGFPAAALSTISGSDSLFTTGRLIGALWLGGAMVLLWLAMAEMRVPWPMRVPVLVLVMTAPTVMEAVATINPDGTTLLAGSAVLLAVLRWERSGRWWWPALAATAAIALKSTNIIAVVMGLAYVGWRALQAARPAAAPADDHEGADPPGPIVWGRIVAVVAGMLAGVAVVSAVWLVVSSSMARVPIGDIPMQARLHVDSIGFREFALNTNTGFTPFDTPYVPAELTTSWIGPMAILVDRLFLVGLGVAAFAAPARSRMRAIAIATFVALAAVGPGFVVVNYFLSDGVYTPIPRRYGLSAVPGMAIALTVLLRDRRVLAAVGTVSALVALATVRALAG